MSALFVGRQAELDAIARLPEAAHSGRGPAVAVITGAPGSGKTRLLAEVARRLAAGRGHARIVGYEPVQHVPLAALAGDQFAGDCATRGVSALSDAFVGVAGPYDPTLLASDPRPPLRQTDPARYEELNPYTHLGGNPRLRVLLLHGADDAAAPPEMSTRFCAALAAAGYDATLTVVEGYGHEIPLSGSPAFGEIVASTP